MSASSLAVARFFFFEQNVFYWKCDQMSSHMHVFASFFVQNITSIHAAHDAVRYLKLASACWNQKFNRISINVNRKQRLWDNAS